MASAPDWSDEEKRRRQQGVGLYRNAPPPSALDVYGSAVSEPARRFSGEIPRPPRAVPPPMFDPAADPASSTGALAHLSTDATPGQQRFARAQTLARAASVGLGGAVSAGSTTAALASAPRALRGLSAALSSDEEPLPAPQPAAPSFAGVTGRATPGLAPGRAPAPGLTRVVRTADGVYTDDPNAQGDVRYYDAIGNRADAPQMPSTGGPTIRDNTSLARWQSENQFNVNDPDVQAAMVEQGAASQAQAQRMGAQGAAALAGLQRQILPPEQRSALEQAEIAAGADDRASMARLQAAQIEAGGRQAAAQTAAQARAAEQLLSHDQWAREFAADPETAEAAMQQELGALENYTPAERRALLTDPTNLQAARLRAMVRGRLAEATGNRDVTPAQIRRSGGLRRIFGSPYNDGAGYWGNGFDPNDFGMSEEEFHDFVFADRDARGRQ